MARHVVARAEDLPPGSRKLIEIEDRLIGVFNIDGKLYALRSRCPHKGASLCEGTVSRAVTANLPGELEWDANTPILRCPWHGWEFDMRNGKSWCEPNSLRVRAYPVERGLGAIVAETYPVLRDQDVIVVEIGSSASNS